MARVECKHGTMPDRANWGGAAMPTAWSGGDPAAAVQVPPHAPPLQVCGTDRLDPKPTQACFNTCFMMLLGTLDSNLLHAARTVSAVKRQRWWRQRRRPQRALFKPCAYRALLLACHTALGYHTLPIFAWHRSR